MKRSEMIQDIATEIVLNRIANDSDIQWNQAQDLANTILYLIEDKGMLPPERLVDVYGPSSPYYGAKEPENTWEPEDT